METLARLEQVILQRRDCDPETSYVAHLRRQGRECMAQKLGEEAVEAVVASLAGSDEELVGEAADVLFHLMVLLADREVALKLTPRPRLCLVDHYRLDPVDGVLELEVLSGFGRDVEGGPGSDRCAANVKKHRARLS